MVDNETTWEEFDYTGASKADNRPYISLQVRGSFQINRASYELMGKPIAVKLLYDRQKQLIGFRPAQEGERASYTVRKATTSETYMVAARAFVNYYDIEVHETRRYQAKSVGNIVAIDLNTPDSATNRGAKAARKAAQGT